MLETKLDTELRHVATKADLERVRSELQRDLDRAVWRLGGLMVLAVSVGVAVLQIWD